MKCERCNALLPNDSEFCQYCGYEISGVLEGNQEENFVDLCINNEEYENCLSNDNKNNATKIKKLKVDKKCYCGLCGGKIDEKSKKCTSCGKQYFRGFKLKYLLYFAVVVMIFALLFLNIMQYIRNVELQGENSKLESKKQELEIKIKDLRESASEEYDRGYDVGYNRGKMQSSMNKTNSIYSYKSEDDENCAIPGCNNDPQMNSFYCFSHECIDVGCHNKKANDFCIYCNQHKCAVSDCNSGKAFNSQYCYIHKN